MQLILTIAIFGGAILLMAIGVLVTGRCLRGTCGGEPVRVAGFQLGCGRCSCKNASDSEPSPEVGKTEERNADPNDLRVL